MLDEYDAFRRKLTNYEKGLYFEIGRALERGETPERGWVRQFTVHTAKGPRVIDSARTEGRGTKAVERKSGRINERDALRQLERERAGLESGKLTHSSWETVEGEKIPRAVAEEMRAMARDFPGRFHQETVSRTAALRAMQLGRSLASKQLELVRAYELNRADRARQRLENIRRIVRTRERAEKFRDMERFREAAARGWAEAPRLVQAERTRQAEQRARRAQAREQAQARAAERPPQVPVETKAIERDPAEQTRTRDDARESGGPVPARERADTPAPPDQAREREEAQAREMVNNLGLGLTAEQSGQLRAILREGRERLTETREPQRDIPARDVVPTVEPATPTREQQSMTEIERAHAKLPQELQRTIELARGPLPTNPVPGLTRAESEAARHKNARRERERQERERGRERGN